MRFLAGVPTHVHHQHVLRLERFLLTAAVLPAAYERFLVGMDVIVVDVLDQFILRGKFKAAFAPVAIRFDEVAWFVLQVSRVDNGFTAARAAH